jgi:hypothetical protein
MHVNLNSPSRVRAKDLSDKEPANALTAIMGSVSRLFGNDRKYVDLITNASCYYPCYHIILLLLVKEFYNTSRRRWEHIPSRHAEGQEMLLAYHD